jgi:hypothetical protein
LKQGKKAGRKEVKKEGTTWRKKVKEVSEESEGSEGREGRKEESEGRKWRRHTC